MKFTVSSDFCVEITSVLQALFAASTILKLKSSKNFPCSRLSVFVSNSGVNKSTIDIAIKILSCATGIPYGEIQFIDMRSDPIHISASVAIIRTRVDKKNYKNLMFKREFFENLFCNAPINDVLKTCNFHHLFGVDDGMSNWRMKSINIIHFFKNLFKGRVLPSFLFTDNARNYVEIFSIFQGPKSNISVQFDEVLEKCRRLNTQDLCVENIFFCVWPSTNRDVASTDFFTQFNILCNYLDSINWDKSKKIYVKAHPKMESNSLPFNMRYQFELLGIDHAVPSEIMLRDLSDVKNIFSFPTTTAGLIFSKKIEFSGQLHLLTCSRPGYFCENLGFFDEFV